MMAVGMRAALTMRIRPVLPVSRWKASSCSMGRMLRASGAKALRRGGVPGPPPLQQALGAGLAGVAEIGDQQIAHLPAVAHFFAINADHRLQVITRRRPLQQVALLFDGGKLGVPLVVDQVDQSVLDALIRN